MLSVSEWKNGSGVSPQTTTTPTGNSGLKTVAQFKASLSKDLNTNTTTQPVIPTKTVGAEPTGIVDAYSKSGVNRFFGSLGAGFLESAGNLLRSAQWASDRVVGTAIGEKIDTTDSFAMSAQEKTKQWGEAIRDTAGITPENQTFFNKVAEGAGSALTFFIPGIGVAKGTTVLSSVSPRIAMMFGGSASASLEAMSEAGSVFDEVKEKEGFEKATENATKTFLANAILLAVTNHFGIFNPTKKGILRKALFSAPPEAFQEAMQQVISNQATGRPTWENVLESGAIGGIVGGVLGGITDSSIVVTPEKEKGVTNIATPTVGRPQTVSEFMKTPAIDQQKAIEAGQTTGTPLPSPTGTVSQNPPIAPEVTPTEGKGSGLVADVRLPEIAPVEPRQKEDAFKAFEKLAKRVKSIEDFQKKINEAEIDNLDDVVQFHGTQNKQFAKALKEGTLRVSEDGVIGKGFYVTNTPELADYFGKQVKDGNARTVNGEKPEIFAIDLRNLNIKKLPFGKGEYYDYLDSRKMSPNDFNAELAQQGYDGLNLEGRGETVIFNSTKVRELPLSGMVKQPKKKKELMQEAEGETKSKTEDTIAEGEYSIKEDKEVGFVVRKNKDGVNVIQGTFSTREKAQEYIDNKTEKNEPKEADDTKKPTNSEVNAKKTPRESRTGEEVVPPKVRKISEAKDGEAIIVRGYHGTPDGRFLEEFDPEKKGYFKNAPELTPDNKTFIELFGDIRKGFRTGGKGSLDVGVYEGVSFTDDKAVAKSYSEKPAFDSDNSVPFVIERNLVLKKPRVIDVKSGEWDLPLEKTIENAKEEGYDSIVFKNIKDNYHPNTTKRASNNVVVFNAESIKTDAELQKQPVAKEEVTPLEKATRELEARSKELDKKLAERKETQFAEGDRVFMKNEKGKREGTIISKIIPADPNSGTPELALVEFSNGSNKPVNTKNIALVKKADLRLELQDKPTAKENPTMTKVQGKEVPRFGFKREFRSTKLEPFKTKPIITKTDLKTIIKYTPELKANPVLTVEMETVDGETRPLLTFRGTSTQFEIKANALGLTEDSLKTGDQVRISIESLSRTGSEFRVIKYDDKGVGSKYASVGRYREDTEMFLSNPDTIKPIQFPELVGLAKELSGNVPFIKKYTKANGMFYPRGDGEIGLNPSLFERENLGQLQKTLAHEIGHLVDYLPDHTMSRGNLMGRLNTLRGFMKDFYAPAGQSRTDKELRHQMYELSKFWRPFDETTASPSFIAYRKSAPEIYADFISALFNAPRIVTSVAPTAYNVFFEQLDNKPDVKTAYFELQHFLRTGDITASRRSATNEMFKTTEQESKERQVQDQIEQEMKEKSIWFKFKTQAVDITEAVRESVKEAEKKGRYVNPDDNPTYYLEERNYLGGKIKAEVDTKFNTIYQELQKDGLTWEDLGELMMYERILKGDRQEIANPLGYQPDFVQELMEVYEDVGSVKADAEAHAKSTSDMKTTLGEDKYRKLQALAVEYRANLKAFFEQGREEGIYSEDLAKMFEENAFYVPFKGAKYSGVTRTTFGVKAQKGTLGNIENPANTGIEKAVSIIRAIERNKVTRKTIEYFQNNADLFPNEVTEAKTDQNGYPMNPREKDLALVTYMKDGKVKGFYVDKYIADAIQKNTIAEQNLLIGSLRFWNSRLFRPLFITFNLGFQTFNLLRDMKRFWKNVPNMTILRTMQLYGQSIRASKIRAFGLPENPSQADREAYDLINKLENEQVISITYNDIIKGEDIEDAQIDRILREVGVREVQDTNLGLLGKRIGLTKNSPLIKQAFGIMDFIEKTGNMIESLPKIAGVKELEGKMQPREMRSFVRKYVGSPDFFAGGKFKPYMNEVFLFSNAIFQGIRSDYEIATTPKSRGAYWLKTAQSELLPKMLMLMAGAGLFGEYLKELFGRVSEYDKTNYTIVPLGTDENGKTVYFRLPSDETGRLIGGMFWKLGSSLSEPERLAELQTYTDMISYAGGQVPSITPVATAGFNLMQFMAGENPYDFFRQRPVLTDDQQQAGGMERTKPFLTYMFQQLGGNVFVKLYTTETVPKNPSLSESIASLPVVGNIAGRFIKASNYGEVEQIRKVTDEVKQEQAQERLVNRRVVFDYVDRSQGMSHAEAEQLKKEMIKEIYGGFPKTPTDRTQARNLEKRFDTLRLRGKADARLDSLLTAQSNEEEVVLLKKYRDELSPEAWAEMKAFIIKNRVVSSAVFQALNSVEN